MNGWMVCAVFQVPTVILTASALTELAALDVLAMEFVEDEAVLEEDIAFDEVTELLVLDELSVFP